MNNKEKWNMDFASIGEARRVSRTLRKQNEKLREDLIASQGEVMNHKELYERELAAHAQSLATIDDLQASLAESEAGFQTYKRAAQSEADLQENTLGKLEDQVARFAVRNADLRAALAAKEAEVGELCGMYQDQIADLRAALAAKEAECERLREMFESEDEQPCAACEVTDATGGDDHGREHTCRALLAAKVKP